MHGNCWRKSGERVRGGRGDDCVRRPVRGEAVGAGVGVGGWDRPRRGTGLCGVMSFQDTPIGCSKLGGSRVGLPSGGPDESPLGRVSSTVEGNDFAARPASGERT